MEGFELTECHFASVNLGHNSAERLSHGFKGGLQLDRFSLRILDGIWGLSHALKVIPLSVSPQDHNRIFGRSTFTER